MNRISIDFLYSIEFGLSLIQLNKKKREAALLFFFRIRRHFYNQTIIPSVFLSNFDKTQTFYIKYLYYTYQNLVILIKIFKWVYFEIKGGRKQNKEEYLNLRFFFVLLINTGKRVHWRRIRLKFDSIYTQYQSREFLRKGVLLCPSNDIVVVGRENFRLKTDEKFRLTATY